MYGTQTSDVSAKKSPTMLDSSRPSASCSEVSSTNRPSRNSRSSFSVQFCKFLTHGVKRRFFRLTNQLWIRVGVFLFNWETYQVLSQLDSHSLFTTSREHHKHIRLQVNSRTADLLRQMNQEFYETLLRGALLLVQVNFNPFTEI